ncbi:10653_t:CDS:2, partial [Funneliformis mosseae]
YIPRDYYTREPRGFAYIEYYDERDCDEAYRHGTVILHGRELTVEFARGSRKTPREMRDILRLDEEDMEYRKILTDL